MEGSKASPRTESRPPRSQNEFLWVNMEGQDLQNRAKIGQVQSFLKSQSHRSRKTNRLRKLKASIQHLPSQSPKLSATTERERDGPRESESDRAELVVHKAFGIGVREAFPSFSVSTSDSLDFYFKYYQIYGARACFPLGSEHMTMLSTQSSKELPLLMLALLSSSASTRAAKLLYTRAPGAEMKRIMHDSLLLRSQAIKSLQMAVERGIGSDRESLFLAIAYLFGLESAENNLAASMAHADGLRLIITMVGGLDGLSPTELSLTLFADLMTGMISDLPPVSQAPPDWEKQALAHSVVLSNQNNYIQLYSLGTGFLSSPWSDVIRPELLEIIQSLRQIIPYFEQNRLGNQLSLSEFDTLIMLGRKLLILPFKDHWNAFQETVRISVFIYLMTRIWSFSGKGSTVKLVQRIRASLTQCVADFESIGSDILFWISFMSCLACQGSESFPWAASGLRKYAKHIGVSSWNGAVIALQPFLFYLQTDDIAKEVWDEAQYVRSDTGILFNQMSDHMSSQ